MKVSRGSSKKVDFLIIGAQKGGSTWLYRNLQSHPQIYTPKEEIHYFSFEGNYGKGVDWYHGKFSNWEDGLITGEKTPEYLTVVPTRNKKVSAETHQRIFQYNPDMKLLVVLREPVGRLRSAINHMYRTRRIPPWVTAKDLISGSYRDHAEEFSLLENGQYSENLQRYLEIFKPHQLKVLFFETDILRDPLITLDNVCNFLGVEYRPEFFPHSNQKQNEYQMSWPALSLNYVFPSLRPLSNRLNHVFPAFKSSIDEDTRRRLQEFYAPSNEKLKEITGSIPKNWVYR